MEPFEVRMTRTCDYARLCFTPGSVSTRGGAAGLRRHA